MNSLGVLYDRKFWPLFWTQFLGAFNDNFYKNALAILIAFQGTRVWGLEPAQMVALSGGIFILPFFLFSAVSGQLADKVEKSHLIRCVKILEIVVMATATAGFLLNNVTFLLIVLFLMGLQSTIFGPVKYSVLPQILPATRDLVAGNALVESGTFLAILIGTIAGGLAIADPEIGGYLVSGGVMFFALLGYFTSLFQKKVPITDPDLVLSANPFKPTAEVYRLTKSNRPVFLSILGISWFWFYGIMLLSMIPTFCKEDLGSTPYVATFCIGIFSVGIGVGSILCERLSRQRLELGLVPLGSIGLTLFAADMFFVDPAAIRAAAPGTLQIAGLFASFDGIRFMIDLLLIAIFGGFYTVPLYTMIQERSKETHRSRIIAWNNILNAIFMVVSSGILMLLLGLRLAKTEIFLILAGLNALVAIYIYTILPEFLLRCCIWLLTNIMYRFRVTGTEHIPQQGSAVFICNHVSFIDWMFIASASQRPPRFVMDENFVNMSIMKYFFRAGKVIPIPTAGRDQDGLERTFDKIAEELANDEIVCIFPEGKVTRNGQIGKFRPGVKKIIERTPVPVVPMALHGMWGSFFSRRYGKEMASRPRRFWSKVALTIGPPIDPKKVEPPYLQEVVEKLFAASA